MAPGLVVGLVVGGVALAIVLALVWWVNRPTRARHTFEALPLFGADVVTTVPSRSKRSDELDHEDVDLDFDEAFDTEEAHPAPVPSTTRRGSTDTERKATRFAPTPGHVSSRDAPHGDTPRTASGSRSSAPASVPEQPVREQPEPRPDTRSVRFDGPTDGTLQFLPGRLEIIGGYDTGRQIRFVRVPGSPTTRVTFGRLEGPAYQHVQLDDQTVSRRHATMELQDRTWKLTNQSTTNPVVHNGRVLAGEEGCTLADGDRIEMGGVTFQYRDR